MLVVYGIVAVVMALALVGSAGAKVTRQARIVETLNGTLGVPLQYFPALAAAEVAGAAGLVLGIWVRALGVAAAVCLVVYFIVATATHLRAGDRAVAPPIGFGVLAAAALVLRLAA